MADLLSEIFTVSIEVNYCSLYECREHIASSHANQAVKNKYVDPTGKICMLCGYTSGNSKAVARHAGLRHNKIEEVASTAELEWINSAKYNSPSKTAYLPLPPSPPIHGQGTLLIGTSNYSNDNDNATALISEARNHSKTSGEK